MARSKHTEARVLLLGLVALGNARTSEPQEHAHLNTTTAAARLHMAQQELVAMTVALERQNCALGPGNETDADTVNATPPGAALTANATKETTQAVEAGNGWGPSPVLGTTCTQLSDAVQRLRSIVDALGQATGMAPAFALHGLPAA